MRECEEKLNSWKSKIKHKSKFSQIEEFNKIICLPKVQFNREKVHPQVPPKEQLETS